MLKHIAALIVLTLCSPIMAAGSVIHVPNEQPTIQAGIDAASNGDTVLVAVGTYTGPGNRNIDFLGKSITVASAEGASFCLIDCQEGDRAFVFQNGEDNGSVLKGFTIINGMGYRGGAILCLSASPTIRDNVFSGCVAENGGGAISCEEGGYSGPLITSNIFTGNDGGDQGGAIYLYECNALITRNTFSGNWADFNGAIHCTDSWAPVISDNLIVDNQAEFGGGAIGSGFYSDPLVINNLITGNVVTSIDGFGGGAILVTDSEITLVNNTIVGNEAPHYGGAICSWDGSLLIVNSIIRDNSSPTGEQAYMIHYLGYSPTLSIHHSNLEGGPDSVVLEPGCDLEWGAGMIDDNPLFLSGPQGDHYLSQVAAGQPVDSPCLDSGDPASEMIWGITRTDHVHDTAVVDLGFHYPWKSVSSKLVCRPASGTLPLPVQFGVLLSNNFIESARAVDARIDVTLAGGLEIPSWKAGMVSIDPDDSFISVFNSTIPMLPQLVGENAFTLVAEDVTPAPYNQPPYPPSGDSDTSVCTVEGIAP